MVHWRPSQVCAISILTLATRISTMPNPLLVVNLNWWRISITQFLFVFSPKWLIPYPGGPSNSRFHLFHLFFSGVPSSRKLCHHGDTSKSLWGFTFCFQLLYLFVILLFTRVIHGGSTCWFIKDVFPFWSVHQHSFQRSSNVLHLAIRSTILSNVSLEEVLCHSW